MDSPPLFQERTTAESLKVDIIALIGFKILITMCKLFHSVMVFIKEHDATRIINLSVIYCDNDLDRVTIDD